MMITSKVESLSALTINHTQPFNTTLSAISQDTSDEVPTFERELYEATVPENVEDHLVTTVKVRKGN